MRSSGSSTDEDIPPLLLPRSSYSSLLKVLLVHLFALMELEMPGGCTNFQFHPSGVHIDSQACIKRRTKLQQFRRIRTHEPRHTPNNVLRNGAALVTCGSMPSIYHQLMRTCFSLPAYSLGNPPPPRGDYVQTANPKTS